MTPIASAVTSTAATAPIGTLGTARIPSKKPAKASRNLLVAGRAACIRTQSSSSKPRRGRVLSKAPSSSRCSAWSSRSSSCSLIGSPGKSPDFLGFSYSLFLHGFSNRLQCSVVQHFRGVFAAAHELADLIEAEPRMPQGDGVPLTLRKLGDARQERAVLNALLGLPGSVGGVASPQRQIPHRSVPPAGRATVIERRLACGPEQPGGRRAASHLGA